MKNRNYYKIGFYILVIPVILFLAYCTFFGVIDRLDAFSEYWMGISMAKVDGINYAAERMPDITGGLR